VAGMAEPEFGDSGGAAELVPCTRTIYGRCARSGGSEPGPGRLLRSALQPGSVGTYHGGVLQWQVEAEARGAPAGAVLPEQ
jgi:hypothetical protein